MQHMTQHRNAGARMMQVQPIGRLHFLILNSCSSGYALCRVSSCTVATAHVLPAAKDWQAAQALDFAEGICLVLLCMPMRAS